MPKKGSGNDKSKEAPIVQLAPSTIKPMVCIENIDDLPPIPDTEQGRSWYEEKCF